jgi:hypothetical protein
MLQVMNQGWRHVLRGYLSVFSLFPTRPRIEIRYKPRSTEEAIGATWLAVGGYIRGALEEVRDESEGSDEQRPPG